MENLSSCLNRVKKIALDGRTEEALAQLQQYLKSSFEIKAHEYDLCDKWIAEQPLAAIGQSRFSSLRVGILGGYTTSVIASAVRVSLLREGFLATIYQAPFDVYSQEVLDARSGFNAFKPELVLFAPGNNNVRSLPPPGSNKESVQEFVGSQAAEFWELCSKIHDRFACPVLMHNFADSNYHLTGIGESRLDWPLPQYFKVLNRTLLESSPSFISILDVDRLAAQVGYQNWNDTRFYHHAKFGFNPKFTQEYATLFTGVFRALWGRAKKCLVLDLDNTLWGGVVAEDGLQGIQLGSVSAVGEAHAAFCRYVLELKKRGILLAVCSKNDEAIAKKVFMEHPEMPLTYEDFSAFYSNWDEKPVSLRKIAQELNLGLSALVFVDDNPVECDFVRQTLPEVTVLELPEDPSDFIRRLDGLHLFDALRLTEEDLKRADSYEARKKVLEGAHSAVDLDAYLKQLEMKAEFYPATLQDLARLSQLETKTNQFNLTTRRYSESQMKQWLERPDARVLACRLTDKFTDHGLVSSLIVVREENVLRIDSWLMSCRVFSRTLEQFIINELAGWAAEQGASILRGEYLPSPANQRFSDLYSELGFKQDVQDENRYWARPLKNFERLKSFILESKAQQVLA